MKNTYTQNNQTIAFALSEELLNTIKEIAKKERRSVSFIVREAVEKYVENN